jgi:hypothetical protein
VSCASFRNQISECVDVIDGLEFSASRRQDSCDGNACASKSSLGSDIGMGESKGTDTKKKEDEDSDGVSKARRAHPGQQVVVSIPRAAFLKRLIDKSVSLTQAQQAAAKALGLIQQESEPETGDSIAQRIITVSRYRIKTLRCLRS